MNKVSVKVSAVLLCLISLMATGCASTTKTGALRIREQGSFAIGGTVVTTAGTFDPAKLALPQGQTFHGDHAYVFYQIPEQERKMPLMFLHGAGQFSKTWETTPDGREGFQNVFLRRGFATYLIDQPRRGDAGRSTVPIEIQPVADEQMWFSIFRIGNWPDFHPNVQFPRDAESLNQFFRQMTPNTGPYDDMVIADSLAALFEKTGKGILVTHSQGGGPGWYAAMKSTKINAIVSYEPGLFIFPENEVPPPISGKSPFDPLYAGGVPMSEFEKLTKIPIVLYFGDNIPETPSDDPGKDNWRTRYQMAKLWTEAVNRHGGDVTLVHLPSIGIYGNTHFPFSDLNSLQVADALSSWLSEKGLDK